jgi:hypothetical protein
MRKLAAVVALWCAAACTAADPMEFRPQAHLDALSRAMSTPVEAAPRPAALPFDRPAPRLAGEADGAGPTSCPAGMKLVEGEYCTEVEQTCLSEWYDKSNKKRVCERFAAPSRCVGAKVKKRYCIDTYEWPNQKGERPEVMNNFYQAQVKCAALGKRMCTESEWTLACEGPEMKPFPHGYERDAKKCNGDHRWDDPDMEKVADRDAEELARLWRGVPSGSQPASSTATTRASITTTSPSAAAPSPTASRAIRARRCRSRRTGASTPSSASPASPSMR